MERWQIVWDLAQIVICVLKPEAKRFHGKSMGKRKIIVICLCCIICASLVAVFICYRKGMFTKASEQQIRYMTNINEANSVIYYYGNIDPGKEITVNCVKVSDFTEDSIGDKKQEFFYHAIVIFDFDGTMNLSDEELLLAKEYCERNYYDLLYYGTKHIENFVRCGYFTILSENDYGFSYNGSYWKHRNGKEEWINPYLLTGNWTKEDHDYYGTKDTHKIWKFVLGFVVDMVKDSLEGA